MELLSPKTVSFSLLPAAGRAALRSSSTGSNERREEAFPVPESWVVPRADFSVGDRGSSTYNMRQVSRFGHFIDPKTRNSYSRRTGCGGQRDCKPPFECDAAKKSVKHPTSLQISAPVSAPPACVDRRRFRTQSGKPARCPISFGTSPAEPRRDTRPCPRDL